MKWLLIFYVFSTPSSVTTEKFDTKEQCEIVAKNMKEMQISIIPLTRHRCVEL